MELVSAILGSTKGSDPRNTGSECGGFTSVSRVMITHQESHEQLQEKRARHRAAEEAKDHEVAALQQQILALQAAPADQSGDKPRS
jgi:hypothetical protein